MGVAGNECISVGWMMAPGDASAPLPALFTGGRKPRTEGKKRREGKSGSASERKTLQDIPEEEPEDVSEGENWEF